MFYASIFHKWCRSGICVLKTAAFEKYTVLSKPLQSESGGEKSNLIDDRKFGNLMKSEHSLNRLSLVRTAKVRNHFKLVWLKFLLEYSQISMWSEWTKPSECESGCLFGESGRLRDGCTGLKTYRRTCHDYR